jgi:hypothetical protein
MTLSHSPAGKLFSTGGKRWSARSARNNTLVIKANNIKATVKVDNDEFDLFEINRKNKPYILLEILPKDRTSPKGLYMISFSKKTTMRIVF